jgi:hypothetical protein
MNAGDDRKRRTNKLSDEFIAADSRMHTVAHRYSSSLKLVSIHSHSNTSA